MMLHVIDDALDEDSRLAAYSYFMGIGESTRGNWVDGSYREICQYGSPLSILLSHVNNLVSLDRMVGCEYWSNLNGKSGWHKDTDEKKLYEDGVENFPICSCVYYPEIEGLTGGDLLFATMRISPVTNRLVVFTPSMLHTVDDFSGNRLSIAMNPWHYKLEERCQ